MNNDDILCEAPGPGGMTCTKPYGHKEKSHTYSIELPPEVGGLLGRIMEETEAAKVKYEKAYRRQRIMFYIWGAMCVFYLALTLMRVVE